MKIWKRRVVLGILLLAELTPALFIAGVIWARYWP